MLQISTEEILNCQVSNDLLPIAYNSWTRVNAEGSAVPPARYGHSATMHPNGRDMYLYGGTDGGARHNGGRTFEFGCGFLFILLNSNKRKRGNYTYHGLLSSVNFSQSVTIVIQNIHFRSRSHLLNFSPKLFLPSLNQGSNSAMSGASSWRAVAGCSSRGPRRGPVTRARTSQVRGISTAQRSSKIRSLFSGA